jgi:fluoroquinolone transport system permease protein
MKALFRLLGWQFKILHKNNLINISIIVTVMYAMIFYLIKDLPNVDKFLILLIYNDPAIIGLFFVGLSVIMEKNDEVLPALFVTPINHHVYLISKILTLSILGWVCATGMTLALLGTNVEWIHFSFGVFSTCVIFSLAGIFVVSYTTEFLNFMLRSIPVMMLLSLPLLNYFGLTDIAFFKLSPIQGPLNLIIQSFYKNLEPGFIYFGYGSTLVWIPLLYFGVYYIFVKRVVKAT